MKYKLSIIIFILCIATVYFFISRNAIDYVKSSLNGKKYIVQNLPDKLDAANILALLDDTIKKFTTYLYNNKDTDELKSNAQYIELLHDRSKNVKLRECNKNSSFTTYTRDKGKEIIFCLRSKNTNKLHDINLLMFVTIHELAHIACPEKDHTPLFVQIFKFLLNCAIKLKYYTYVNYKIQEIEYCGMIIDQTPI